MSLLRHAGRWSAAAVLLFAAVATASAPAAVCAPTDASSSSASTLVSEDTSASWGPFCFESLCDTDADCRNACPSASSATCNGSVCSYDYGGGGGGGGGGGPYCEARLCMSDMDCSCGSRGGYCDGNSTCQYY